MKGERLDRVEERYRHPHLHFDLIETLGNIVERPKDLLIIYFSNRSKKNKHSLGINIKVIFK